MPGVREKGIKSCKDWVTDDTGCSQHAKAAKHWTKVWEHKTRHRSRSRTDDHHVLHSSTNEGLHAAHIAHVARWMMQRNLTPTPLNKGDPVVKTCAVVRPLLARSRPASVSLFYAKEKKGKERPNARLPSDRDRSSLVSMSWISSRSSAVSRVMSWSPASFLRPGNEPLEHSVKVGLFFRTDAVAGHFAMRHLLQLERFDQIVDRTMILQVGFIAKDQQWYAFHRRLLQQYVELLLCDRQRFLIGRVDDETKLVSWFGHLACTPRSQHQHTLWRSLLGSISPTLIETSAGRPGPSCEKKSAAIKSFELHLSV